MIVFACSRAAVVLMLNYDVGTQTAYAKAETNTKRPRRAFLVIVTPANGATIALNDEPVSTGRQRGA
jgi:hypothetical protein